MNIKTHVIFNNIFPENRTGYYNNNNNNSNSTRPGTTNKILCDKNIEHKDR